MSSRHSRFAIAAALLAAVGLSGPLGDARAQTTLHYKEVHYQITDNMLPVGDPAAGRLYGVWARRGLTFFDGGEVATYAATGHIDITKGVGTISGFDTTHFADGSTWSTRFTGQFSVGPKGLWVIPHEGEFVGGTGRFAGISGKLVYTSRQVDKRPEFATLAETDGSATYTLPAK
jgi:hypothetical protein